jgi:tetratricopeptide (TPR) repeat protein
MMSSSSNERQGMSLAAIVAIGLVIAFFLAIAVFSIRSFTGFAWSPSVDKIDRLLKIGKYKEALRLAQARGGREPSASALLQQGRVWMALAWKRQNEEGWKHYGTNERDWLDCPEADKAEQVLQQALTKEPDNPQARHLLGTLYMERGWFRSAETELRTVLRQDSNFVRARISLGALYSRMDRLDAARQQLLAAHRVEPDNPDVAKNLSLLYRFYLDRPDSAMLWANRYLNLNPKGDWEINLIRDEMEEMLQRYPEYSPSEPMDWKDKNRFPSRR